MLWGLLATLLWLFPACGGSPDGPGSDPATPTDRDAPGPATPAPDDPAAPTPDPIDPPDATPPSTEISPSDTECQTLLDHFLSIAHAEHAATVTPDLVPTKEQLAEIRTKLEPEFLATCREFSRATYDCIARAKSQKQVAVCSTL